jgi:hypothetical protein
MTAANLTLTKPALVFVTSDPTVPEHIELTYSWTPGDPFALQLIFSDGDDDGEGNTWNSSFELFFNASADPQSAWHGEGDVAVQICGISAFIALRSSRVGENDVLVKTPADDLVPWLNRVREVQVERRAAIEAMVNAELDAMLMGA